MRKAAVELPVALALCALCVAGLLEASGYRGQSSYFPLAVIGFATVLAAIWAGQSAIALARGAGARFEARAGDLARFGFVVAVIVVYTLGVAWLGFFTSTIVMVPVLAAVLGYRQWGVSLVATLAFVTILYGVFRLLLAIPLPREAVLGFIGG
jgi:putative tricarboxylic transport membrane protein